MEDDKPNTLKQSRNYISEDGSRLLASEMLTPAMQLITFKFVRHYEGHSKRNRRFVHWGGGGMFRSSKEMVDHLFRDYQTQLEHRAGPVMHCPGCCSYWEVAGCGGHFTNCIKMVCALCRTGVLIDPDLTLLMRCDCRESLAERFVDPRDWIMFKYPKTAQRHLFCREEELDSQRFGLEGQRRSMCYRDLMKCCDENDQSLNDAFNQLVYHSNPLRFHFYRLYEYNIKTLL